MHTSTSGSDSDQSASSSDSEATLFSDSESISESNSKKTIALPIYEIRLSEKSHILKTEEGEYELRRKLANITKLTLSGGGARGVAYPMAFQVLEDKGHLETIEDIYAASVGAITGSLLASGMSPKKIQGLVNNINLVDLISKNEIPELSNSSKSSSKKSEGLFEIVKKIAGTNAPNLRRIINEQMRDSLIEHINEANINVEKEPIIKNIYNKLTNDGSVTFNDLETLNKYIPEIKKFNCTATVTFGFDEPQTVLFNASTFPNMPIAEAVCASAALPFIFSKIKFKQEYFTGNKQAIEKNIPTQDRYTESLSNAKWADGGLLVNTPIPALMHGSGDPAENLVFVFESTALNQAAKRELPDNLSLIQRIAEFIIGARYETTEKLNFYQLYENIPHENIVTIPTTDIGNKKKDYSGLEGMTAFNMTQDEKNSMGKKAASATLEKINEREKKEHKKTFDSLEKLIYSLNDEEFNELKKQVRNSINSSLEKSEISEELKNLDEIIRQRDNLSDALNHFLKSMKNILQEENELIEKAGTANKATSVENTERAARTENIIKLAKNESKKILKLTADEPKEKEKFIANKLVEYYLKGLDKINYYHSPEEFTPSKKSEKDINLNEIHHYLTIETTIDLIKKNANLLHHLPIFNIVYDRVNEIHIKNISNNIIKDLIYPEKNKPIQLNMAALKATEKKLAEAKTREDVNNAIDTLINKSIFPIINSAFLKKAQTYKLKSPTSPSSPDNSKKSIKSKPLRSKR